ncbi:MAG: hypothetical protein HOV80_15305 [Polyangiaceae bacterium]|nr:hypothetical protein [Polyangiaceae bacterium]
MKPHVAALGFSLASLCLLGCDKLSGGGSASAEASSASSAAKTSAPAPASATAAASGAPAASASAAAAPAGGLDGFKDFDISSYGKVWQGYSIKAPDGAVMKKSFGGPEIKKEPDFRLELSFADTRLQNTADATKECVNYDQKCAVLEQTKDLVITSASYKSSKGDVTSYGFHMLVRPGGTTISCKGGADDRKKLDTLMAACNTLGKK